MLLVVLLWSLPLAALGQQVNDDWVDPYDMLNYDSSSKTMRKPTTEVSNTFTSTLVNIGNNDSLAYSESYLHITVNVCVPQTANYDNVATKRREYDQDSSKAQLDTCSSQVVELKKQVRHVNTLIEQG